MLENYKTLISNQYRATFKTLQHCVEKCSDESWNQPVCSHLFCQSIFHGLFFADVYLGDGPAAVEDQDFHRQNADVFAGYEEWEDRPPEKTYSKTFVLGYLEHCKAKADSVIAAMTESSLAQPAAFPWIKGTTAEVHVYNIRHIQHHAAQLSLRLRIDTAADVPWVKSGEE